MEIMGRIMRWIALVCLLSLVSSCGGGGGGSRPEFERVTVGSFSGIKDNQTGLVWASKVFGDETPDPLPLSARLPYARELFNLVDRFEYQATASKKTEMLSFFDFALNAPREAFELKETSPTPLAKWAMIFGQDPNIMDPQARGLLYLDERTTRWFVLSEESQSSSPNLVERPDGTVFQGNKVWKSCPEGMNYDRVSKKCSGEAFTYLNLTDADDAVRDANQRVADGYNDWRIPTKLELSTLIALESEKKVFIRDTFASRFATNAIRRPFLTSTKCTDPSRCQTWNWVVQFSSEIQDSLEFVVMRPFPPGGTFHLLLIRGQ